MSVIIPNCTSCKHFTDNKNEDGHFCCSAFPNGIPKDYFWGQIDVLSIPECANGVKFEKINDLKGANHD